MRTYIIILATVLCNYSVLGQSVIQAPGPICEGDSTIQLSAALTGGIWGGDADSSGVFTALGGSAGNPYVVTYTYQDTSGQTVIDSLSLNINPVTAVTITPAGPFCETSGTQQLSASIPNGTWSSSDGSTDLNGEFKPFFGAANSPYMAFYAVIDTNGCVARDTAQIIVLDVPTVSLSAPGNVCPDDQPFQVIASPPSGIWLSGVDSTGQFNPMSNPPGSYQVVYSFTDTVSGCTNVASLTIDLLSYAIPSGFNFSTLCSNGGVDTLEALGLVGGILFSGAADATGVMDPDSLGVGIHYVHFMTGCISCCPYMDSVAIEVIEPSNLILRDSIFCSDTDSALIITNGSVGQWGGVANQDGYIFPAILGTGTYSLVMEGLDANGCPVSDTSAIEVLPRPLITLTNNSPYCAGSLPDTMNVAPAGGSWSGPIDTLGVFSVMDTAGIYPIAYSYGPIGFCTNTILDTLIVLGSPQVSIDPVPGFCSSDSPFLLSGQPSGGIWSGGSSSTGIFDPGQALISGTIAVYYSVTDSTGCSGIDSTAVVVLLEPEITFGQNGPFCQGVGLQMLTASPGLGVWGGSANPDGTFDGNNEPDTYVVSYTVSNGLCVVTAFDTVVVDDCTSIEEFTGPHLSIYPDPADTEIIISSSESVIPFDRLSVVDLFGRPVYEEFKGVLNRKTILTGSWASGQYSLIIDGAPVHRFQVVH